MLPSIISPSISLTQQYLFTLSSHIQTLNKFYLQQSFPPLSSSYKHLLQQKFSQFNFSLQIFKNDAILIQSLILNLKKQLNIFLYQRMINLLEKQTQPIANIMKFLLEEYKQGYEGYENLIIQERKRKLQEKNQQVEVKIKKMKKEILVKREYVKDLEKRIKELEQENRQIYEKIIKNTKDKVKQVVNTTGNTNIKISNISTNNFSALNLNYNPSTTLPSINSLQLLRLKSQTQSSHKTLSFKQVEQILIQIIQSKHRQQSINPSRTHLTLPLFLQKHFSYKFGISNLKTQILQNFKSALKYFIDQNQPSLFILFQKMVDQQCEQSYYYEYQKNYKKIVAKLKRYLNEKDKLEYEYLDRVFDSNGGKGSGVGDGGQDIMLKQEDVKILLINVYKNKQVQSLVMMFGEIMGKSISDSQVKLQDINENTLPLTRLHNSLLSHPTTQPSSSQPFISSKRLLNQIMNYQIQKHLIKIRDIIKVIKYYQKKSQNNLINYNTFQSIILDLKINQDKYTTYIVKNYDKLKGREMTLSEVVEIYGEILTGKKG